LKRALSDPAKKQGPLNAANHFFRKLTSRFFGCTFHLSRQGRNGRCVVNRSKATASSLKSMKRPCNEVLRSLLGKSKTSSTVLVEEAVQ